MPSPALNIIIRNPLDREALSFCAASGATDKRGISDFVRGIKALGLWDSLVCWPLRSSQNSGGADPTNTTVYSLGGLGTFNGTRTNGPTWGSDGLARSATNNYISIPSLGTTFDSSGSVWAVFPVQTTESYVLRTKRAMLGWEGGAFRFSSPGEGSLGGILTSSLTGRNFLCGAYTNNGTNTTGRLFVNSALSDTSRTAGQATTDTTVVFNYLAGSTFAPSETSITGICRNMTQAESSALFALYKSTLGQGLALP